MTYLTKSLIAIIISGAILVVGATASLAQDTESTETVAIDPVDPTDPVEPPGLTDEDTPTSFTAEGLTIVYDGFLANESTPIDSFVVSIVDADTIVINYQHAYTLGLSVFAQDPTTGEIDFDTEIFEDHENMTVGEDLVIDLSELPGDTFYVILGDSLPTEVNAVIAPTEENADVEGIQLIDPVDPIVCGNQGVLQLLSASGHNGTASVKRFNLDTGNYDNIGWSIKQHADHNSMGYSFRDFNGAAINPIDSKVYGTIKGQHQQSNRYFVRFDMDGDFEILAKIGPWVAAGAFDLSGTWYGPDESGTGGVVIPNADSLVGYSTMDDFAAAESTPFFRANGFSFSKPRGDKSAHDIVIVEEESQKLMIGISDTGVIQIKNLITGVETQFTGPVDEGLIPGGDYGAAYNFQNEVYASNNNGNGMIWIDWRNADYENNTIRTVNVFSKTQRTNRNDGINCVQEQSPLDIPEEIDSEPLCDLFDEADGILASDSDCVPCPTNENIAASSGDCEEAPVTSTPCPLPGLGHLDDTDEACDFEINDVPRPRCAVEGLGLLLSTDEACVEPVAMCEIDGLETLTADDENCEEVEEVVITDGGDSEEDNSTEEKVEETPETEDEVEEIAITDKAPETQEELPVTGGMHLYMIAIAALLLVLGTAALTINKLIPTNKTR